MKSNIIAGAVALAMVLPVPLAIYTSDTVNKAQAETTANATAEDVKTIVGVDDALTVAQPNRYVDQLSDSVSVVMDGYAKGTCAGDGEYSLNPTANERYTITCTLSGNVKNGGNNVRVTPRIVTFSDVPLIGGLKTVAQNAKVEYRTCSDSGCSWKPYPTTTITLYANVYEGVTTMVNGDSMVTELAEDGVDLSDIDVDSLSSSTAGGEESGNYRIGYGDTGSSNSANADANPYQSTDSSANSNTQKNNMVGTDGELREAYGGNKSDASTSIGNGITNPDPTASENGIKSSIASPFDNATPATYDTEINTLFNDDPDSLNYHYNAIDKDGEEVLDDYFGGVEDANPANGIDVEEDGDFLNVEHSDIDMTTKPEKYIDKNGRLMDGYFDDDGSWIGSDDPVGIAGYIDPSGKLIPVKYLPGAYGVTYTERADEQSGRWAQQKQMLASICSIVESPLMKNSTGSFKQDSLIDSLTEALGNLWEGSAFDAPSTISNQQLYTIAKGLLAKRGYSSDDLKAGYNYDPKSAYTDPTYSWDFHRITRLLKTGHEPHA
ncbi:MAG: hypothetical protein K6E91_12390 [Butyrivibrio sp.]|nr:hypothetical protein [Butyrivibrio sp.]